MLSRPEDEGKKEIASRPLAVDEDENGWLASCERNVCSSLTWQTNVVVGSYTLYWRFYTVNISCPNTLCQTVRKGHIRKTDMHKKERLLPPFSFFNLVRPHANCDSERAFFSALPGWSGKADANGDGVASLSLSFLSFSPRVRIASASGVGTLQ